MKSKILAGLSLASLMLLPGTAMADTTDLSLIVNESYIETSENMGQAYINDDGRTMIPLRLVNSSLGYETDWQNDGSIHISSKNGEVDVNLKVGSTSYLANGVVGNFETKPVIKNDRTYLPARDFSELYGSIYWDDLTRTVWIYQDTNPCYKIIGNNLVRANGSEICNVLMPKGQEVSSIGKADYVATQRTIGDSSYVGILYDGNHSQQCELFRDDGEKLTYLTKINSSSSFWVNGDTIYHTEGTDAGPWSSSINPDVLIVTKLKNVEENVKYDVGFEVNTCTLSMENNKLIAEDPSGERHIIDVDSLAAE